MLDIIIICCELFTYAYWVFYMIFKYCFKMCFLYFVCILCFVRNDKIKLWNQSNAADQVVFLNNILVANIVLNVLYPKEQNFCIVEICIHQNFDSEHLYRIPKPYVSWKIHSYSLNNGVKLNRELQAYHIWVSS